MNDLATLWRERHPEVPPLAHRFRSAYADRWVRFHSLPESKRYPEGVDEYAIVLHRHNMVLDELFAGQDVFVVTMDWSDEPDGPAAYPTRQELQPEGVRWWTESCFRLYAARRPWRPGCVDELLRAVADEAVAEVFLTDPELRRIHHPYDGGADVILTTPEERDRLRARHSDWLSVHPGGM